MVRDGYKETEIGEIPEEWNVKKLGDIGECLIGLTYNPDNVRENGLLVLRSSNIVEGSLRFDDNVFVDMDVPDKIIVQMDDILICVRNGSRSLIGKCALIDERAVGMTFGAFMSVFRTDYPRFVFYQFQSNIVKKQIYEHLGATINQITNKSLHSFSIALPPDKKEQIAIAAVLSTIDEAIEKTEALIAKLRQVKAGLMQDLLTKGIDEEGRVRSEETHAFKDTEIGRVPVEWEVAKVSDYCSVILSNVDKKVSIKEIPVFLCNYLDVFNNDYITSDLRFMEGSATTGEIQKCSIYKNDVLITKDSETAEEIAITTVVIEDCDKVLCGYHLAIIRPKPDEFNGIFLSKTLNFTEVHRQFVRGAKGVTRYGLNKSEIENAILPLPMLTEQSRIATILTEIDNQITEEFRYQNKLLTMKKGLMADLLTGKIRVQESIEV